MSGHGSRLAGLAVLAVLAIVFEVRCGARTPLPPGEPCAAEGSTRGCSNACGSGKQICENAFWGMSCIVPPVSRPCSNACGNGTQTCVGGAWPLKCDDVPIATRPCTRVCGAGTKTCREGAWDMCNAPGPVPPTLPATIRDFLVPQPDFYYGCCQPSLGPAATTGLVAFNLGTNGDPVYTGNPAAPYATTHGAADFNEWYTNVPGTNQSIPYALVFTTMAEDPGQYVFDDEMFLAVTDPPVPNDAGFGRFGAFSGDHDFTLEAHTRVLYVGGETYSFASDDDLWVFINQRLALDLGGLHDRLTASIDLDALAGELGISKGQRYPLDLFYANRQPPGAVLMISIPATDIWACPP
jgi:fibro-slime domain-containing protein